MNVCGGCWPSDALLRTACPRAEWHPSREKDTTCPTTQAYRPSSSCPPSCTAMAFFGPPAQGWDNFLRELDRDYWADCAARTCRRCGTTSWNRRTKRTWCHCKVRRRSFWIPCNRHRWKRNPRHRWHMRGTRRASAGMSSQATGSEEQTRTISGVGPGEGEPVVGNVLVDAYYTVDG